MRVQNALPDILAVVQVALEGAISSANAQAALARGNLPQVSTPVLVVAATADMQLHADPAQHMPAPRVAFRGLQAYCLKFYLWLHVVMHQGDLIPWTVGQQFQDADFPRLSGARIVRIAVHPSVTRAG